VKTNGGRFMPDVCCGLVDKVGCECTIKGGTYNSVG